MSSIPSPYPWFLLSLMRAVGMCVRFFLGRLSGREEKCDTHLSASVSLRASGHVWFRRGWLCLTENSEGEKRNLTKWFGAGIHHLNRNLLPRFSKRVVLLPQLHADPATTQNSSWPSATVTSVGTQSFAFTVLFKHTNRAPSSYSHLLEQGPPRAQCTGT